MLLPPHFGSPARSAARFGRGGPNSVPVVIQPVPAASPRARTARRAEAALAIVVLVWAASPSMVKYGVDMGNPYAFNLARLVPASLVLLFAVARTPALRKFEWRDTWSVFVLGVVGHVVFQVGFIHGTHASSATSSALILALTACGGTHVSAEAGEAPG